MSEEQWASQELKTPSLNLINSVINWALIWTEDGVVALVKKSFLQLKLIVLLTNVFAEKWWLSGENKAVLFYIKRADMLNHITIQIYGTHLLIKNNDGI